MQCCGIKLAIFQEQYARENTAQVQLLQVQNQWPNKGRNSEDLPPFNKGLSRKFTWIHQRDKRRRELP